MDAHAAVQVALKRFQPNHPNAPANTFVFGFILPDEPAFAISIGRDHAVLLPDLRDAEYLISGTGAQIAALFTPDYPDRAAVVAQITMRPAYPFNNYLLSILLNGLDLALPDLDYTAKRMEGVFPFPPRYPAHENPFRDAVYTPTPLPAYDRDALPALIADDHPGWVAMYDFAWRTAFKNLRHPEPGTGFIANFIDAAFNPNMFMWDSCFMMMFGKYGRRVFPFMGTLDNFYAKQDDDGFICREINTYSGTSVFQPLDPRSTGPNLFAWTELDCFRHSGDLDRLRAVFPGLVAFHRWLRAWRTHPDASYWSSGWGSGMDNQTRVPQSEYHHRHYTWVDATIQAALNCTYLVQIGRLIGRHEFVGELSGEYARLCAYLNDHLWSEPDSFYCDRAPDGTLSHIKSIGAYWALLLPDLPAERKAALIAHLENPRTFNRPHRVPTVAADSAGYNPYGGYWMGGVWSPTNYMVLRGLSQQGADDLAHRIALNHVEKVAAVFEQTRTLYENYAPEYAQPGRPAGRDFVGWTGVSAIAIPIEYGIGLRVNGENTLTWDIRLTERHGVLRYPVGPSHTVDLVCEARTRETDALRLTVRTRHPLRLTAAAAGRMRCFSLPAGEHQLDL